MNREKVYIFNPSVRNGGTNNLLTNFGICIGNLPNVELRVIDFKDGECVKRLRANDIPFEHIVYKNETISVENGIFVSILLHLKHIINGHVLLTDKTRLLLWSTHPLDAKKIIPTSNIFLKTSETTQKRIASLLHPFYYKRLKAFFQKAVDSKGLVFMDELNFTSSQDFYNIKTKGDIWPIFTSIPILSKSKIIAKDRKIRITFLNRIVDFKYNSTLAFLKQLKDVGLEYQLVFIGDGPFRNKLREDLIELNFKDYKFLGNVPIERLDEKLVDTDMCVSMATSVLEASKLKIPTICLPLSYKEINYKEYQLVWFHKIIGVDICEFEPTDKNRTYEEYINNLRTSLTDPEILSEYGAQCYLKWQNSFSQEMIKQSFLDNIEENSLYYNKALEKMLKPDVLSSIVLSVKQKILARFDLLGDDGFKLVKRK